MTDPVERPPIRPDSLEPRPIQPDSVESRPTQPGFIDPLRIGPETLARGAPDGPLTAVTVAVKDIVDVAGVTTGAGNPDWLAAHEPAERHAAAVQLLLDAGATVIGKSHTDEFAWSLSGTNHHYGTPRNPAAPSRVPGGSSSGSASAVALGITDIAIGTDTAGSIRVPSSYCGLYGIRPSHGRVPVKGILPLAWSFDTCGLFAADAELLQRAARVLLGSGDHRATAGPAKPLKSLVLATDLVDQADPAVATAVRDGAAQLADALRIPLTETSFGADRIPSWLQAFRARQMVEAWQANGPWITANRPRLGPGVAGRFAAARATIPSAAVPATTAGIQVRRALEQALPRDAALVLPSAATVAPPPDLNQAANEDLRTRTIGLTCLAGLAGAPAVSLPLGRADGLPVGVCLLGRVGEDERLLAAAAAAHSER
jgi:amidase